MDKAPNWLQEIQFFYRRMTLYPISATAQALWQYLMVRANGTFWIYQLCLSQQEIAGVLSVSTSAVRRARDELVQNKYIYYLEGRKRHPGEYVLLSCRDPKRLMCGGPSQVLMLQLKD